MLLNETTIWGGFPPEGGKKIHKFLCLNFYSGPGRPQRRCYTHMLPERLRTQCKHKERELGIAEVHLTVTTW